VAVSLLASYAGRMAVESLLSNLNEPRNNIVRGVSVSSASGLLHGRERERGRKRGAFGISQSNLERRTLYFIIRS